MVTAQDVLDEFAEWLDEQPETPATRWVEQNPPDLADAVRMIIVCKISLSLMS